MADKKGVLLILSGPSGCGKDTIIKELKERCCDIKQSVSATTRAMREGEIDGVDYYFTDIATFEENIKKGYFLEYVKYGDNYYGTPKKAVDEMIDSGVSVLLKIEVEGAGNVRKIYPDIVSVFIIPPSMQVLSERLRGRGTETDESFCKRIDAARDELKRASEYDYVVINDDLEQCVTDVCSILKAEQSRYGKMAGIVTDIINE